MAAQLSCAWGRDLAPGMGMVPWHMHQLMATCQAQAAWEVPCASVGDRLATAWISLQKHSMCTVCRVVRNACLRSCPCLMPSRKARCAEL